MKFLLFSAEPKAVHNCIDETNGVSLLLLLSNAADGYTTGLSWKHSHRPGGPCDIYPGCKLLRRAWFKGFNEGLQDNQKLPLEVKQQISHPSLGEDY